MRDLQEIYNMITSLLLKENVILDITKPRPCLKRVDKDGKILEYLYFDEASKFWEFSSFNKEV